MSDGPRAALVTGGSAGIGLAIARVLVEEGIGVTLMARRPEPLQAAAAELRGLADGVEVHGFAGDAGAAADVARAVAEHDERFGRLDVLVNSAGVMMGAPIAELSTEAIDAQLGANLRSLVLAYREAVPLMRLTVAASGWPLVVNLSSIAGKRGFGGNAVYSATKFGVIGFTQAMNNELCPDRIRSCALCPGLVETPMGSGYVKGPGLITTQRRADDGLDDALIRTEDIGEVARMLLRVSPACVVSEMTLQRIGNAQL